MPPPLQCLPDKEVVCQKKRMVTTPDELTPSPFQTRHFFMGYET